MILLPISDQEFVEARRVGGTLWKDFLKRGQEFEIAPGDGFLLPANWYHIGFSPEYTVDVSITIQPISRAEQSKFWLNRIVNSCDDDLGKCDFLEATEFLLGMAGSKQSVGSWASDQFQIFCASQRSNRCFRSLPMLKSLGKSRWKAIERTRFAPEVVDVRGGVYAVSRGYVRRLKNVTEIEIARSIISHGSMFIETGMYGQSDLITWLLRTGSFLPFGEAADDLPE